MTLPVKPQTFLLFSFPYRKKKEQVNAKIQPMFAESLSRVEQNHFLHRNFHLPETLPVLKVWHSGPPLAQRLEARRGIGDSAWMVSLPVASRHLVCSGFEGRMRYPRMTMVEDRG